MTEPHYCAECESPLPGDAPAELCPNCLLKLALGTVSGGVTAFPHRGVPSVAGARVHYFGDYELLEEIARGGMGVVYKARQMSLNRIVAVKMMRPGLVASETGVQRFRVEAEAAASLQHPGIVAIHEVGEHDGLCYFSMDYVQGKSLAEMVRERPLTSKRAASYVKAIADAVQFAHERKVLHRDLKPSNVIIDSADQPRITDFGIARRIEHDSRLTETGAVLGTPSYMPPEQAGGKREPLGPASDVYSLGAMLYELLTGRPPFQGETPVDTLLMVLNSEPVAPRMLNPRLDRDIETICLKCIEKDSRRRYQSARELADDLGRFIEGMPIKARRVDPVSRAWRWCRRNPWPTIAGAVFALLAIVGIFSATTLRERLWRSMVEQARSERLAGNRARSMELLREAARMKKSEELRREAIQTITTPGLRLRFQVPSLDLKHVSVSADSTLLGVACSRPVWDGRRSSNKPEIEVWNIESGKMISSNDYRIEDAIFAFSPVDPLLTALRAEYDTGTERTEEGRISTKYLGMKTQSMILWNAITEERVAEIKCEGESCGKGDGPIVFSPDGRRIVRGSYDREGWLVDMHEQTGKKVCIDGDLVMFRSNDELLSNCGGRLRLWNIATGQRNFVTPDGYSFVSLSRDARIALLRSKDSLCLFDLQTKEQTTVATAVSDQTDALLSGDGRIVALINRTQPNVIHLYETTAAGTAHRAIVLGSNSKVEFGYDQASFSPDGSFLAAFGGQAKQGGVWVWDTATGAEVAVLREHCGPVWSNDSRSLITRGPGSVNDGHITQSSSTAFYGIRAGNSYLNIWEVSPPAPAYLAPDNVGSIAFTPDGKGLLSNGVAWDVAAIGDRIELRPIPQELPADSTVLAEGNQLWVARGMEEGLRLRLWQLSPGRRQAVLEADYSGFKTRSGGKLGASASKFSISPDGGFLVMTSELYESNHYAAGNSSSQTTPYTALELWNLIEGKRLAIWNEADPELEVSNVKFSPDGRLVATAARTGHTFSPGGITIRDAVGGKEIRRLEPQPMSFATTWNPLAFSPDAKLVFSSGGGASGPSGMDGSMEGSRGFIFVNDVDTGRSVGAWDAHGGIVRSFAISSDGKMLASGGDDHMIVLWEIPSGRRLGVWEAHKCEVTALTFSADGRTLVSGANDGTLRLWDIPRIRRELATLGLEW